MFLSNWGASTWSRQVKVIWSSHLEGPKLVLWDFLFVCCLRIVNVCVCNTSFQRWPLNELGAWASEIRVLSLHPCVNVGKTWIAGLKRRPFCASFLLMMSWRPWLTLVYASERSRVICLSAHLSRYVLRSHAQEADTAFLLRLASLLLAVKVSQFQNKLQKLGPDFSSLSRSP